MKFLKITLAVILTSCAGDRPAGRVTPAMMGSHQKEEDYSDAKWWERMIYETVEENVKN